MLDIKFIKENKDLVKEAARKKQVEVDIDKLCSLDDDRLKLMAEIEAMRAKQNEFSKRIVSITDPAAKQAELAGMASLKEELSSKEDKLKELMKEWQSLMVQVPNIPDMSVPVGRDDSENQEIKKWGEREKPTWRQKSQVELVDELHLADLERGSKVSGFRGYFLENEGVLLSFALWQFALDMLVKDGFKPMIVPSLVKKEPFFGTGYLPQGEEDLYKTQDGDYLAGTGEVAAMAYYMDEVLKLDDLPKKIVAFSPCFRREAGSHGKDTRGLIRLHEFYKVEQVVLCEANHEESVRQHEALLANAEKYMQALGIPYRVVVNCTGDLGLGQVKKYDIEAWVPSENKYRETHSISYFHDFQTRRLGIRYKDSEGKTRYVHSLNGTMSATPRLLVSLVENYQNEDGSVTIPEVLRPYVGGREVIR
jgi:seryl-tRNA synthetase